MFVAAIKWVFAWLVLHPNLHKIIDNSRWLFLDRLLRLGGGLLITVWLARYIGPDQFGVYSYAIAFTALFNSVATLGLDTVVIWDIVRTPDCSKETLGTAFILKLLGGGIAAVLSGVVFSLWRPQEFALRWLIIIIGIGMLFQSFDVIDFWFQSQVRSKYTVYAKGAAFLIIAFVKIVLIQLQAPIITFVVANVIEIVLGAVGLIIAYSATGQSFSKWRFRILCARQLLVRSWPLIFAGLAIMIYMKIDLIMLGELANARVVGSYSAATRLSEMWYFIPSIIVTSIFPSIVRAKTLGHKEYYSRLQNLFDLMAIIALVIAFPVTFFSGYIIQAIYATDYAISAPILSIHIWATIFVFLGVAQSSWDVTEGLTHLSLIRTIMGAITNVALNLILIPSLGGIGAAISTVISYAISACLANVIDRRTRSILLLQARALISFRYILKLYVKS